ncbi:hypothetical protein IW261DRAFT_1603886 [Armillaria novae-zelandiae]|uniref:F-box domain-containing protein n=1 Tax=Armillaria novae-zelandiae TaxID=153914 RepID=A0AA39PP65_9AGAR|nr:hypothetical protein IW261DRAFT_1603886 [Armillaria novae-zelandiae]
MSSNPADPLDKLVQTQHSDIHLDLLASFASITNSTSGVPKAMEVLAAPSRSMSGALQLTDIECAPNPYPRQKKNLHILSVDFAKYTPGPIAHLPGEMLMEIFNHCATSLGDIYYDPSSSVYDPSWRPWVISRVCHQWRDIVIENCPKFSLDWDWSRWDYKNNPVALLSLALSRSGNEPLIFRLEEADGKDIDDLGEAVDRDVAVTEEIIRTLVNQCHRWKNVSFTIPRSLFHLLLPIRGQLPALVDFEFNEAFPGGWRSKWRLPSRIVSDILDGAPLLERLTLKSSFDVRIPEITIIPRMCPKLRSFTDGRQAGVGVALSHQHFLDIVENSPSLRHIDVQLTGFFPTADPRIVNTSITKLSVCSGSFLRSIILPNVKKVRLHGPARGVHLYIHDGVASLYDLVTHSGCSLTSLSIIGCAVDERLIFILRASPELVSLYLSFDEWRGDSMQTIQSLIADLNNLGKAEPAFVPNLQNFSLISPEGSSLSLDM